jgi:hypothetical protein
MRLRQMVPVGLVVLAVVAGFAAPAAAGQVGPARHGPVQAAAAASRSATSPRALCQSPPSAGRNVLTSCDQVESPHNETAVAVNPKDPRNIIASANDYQFFGSGSHVTETVLSRAHVSFDGGRSWTDFVVPYPPECTGTGDPSLDFDAAGTAYLTTLCGDTGGVLVTSSTDGGRHWAEQTLVTAGSPSLFNDHSTLAAWGQGNVVVTWIPYFFNSSGNITTVPMMAAVSHDRGAHFGASQVVSGSAPQCVGLTAPHACDQAWGNAVDVSATGELLATFFSTTQYRPDGSTNLGRNFHFAVRLDPATGARSAGPYFIGRAYDGILTHDYPVNVDGRQTLHDSQLRILMQGNIAADPTDPRHFAVVWFDDRSAPHPVDPDPYKARTDSDIIVSQTYDHGVHWSPPAAIREAGDQFFGWAAYDAKGRLRIGYFDRGYDTANHRYGYTVATEARPGSLRFLLTQVTTTLSDPTRGNRWFAVDVDPRFPRATRFLGDYSGIATTSQHVIAVWTDQRLRSCRLGPCGAGQDTYAASVD